MGCGTRSLADRANIFRICAFEQSEHDDINSDTVIRLAFEVDDMTGEEIAQATQILQQQAGVLDVTLLALTGKKNRPATGLRLLIRPSQLDAVVEQCFLQTTTLGVRHSQVERRVLSRAEHLIDGRQVKTANRPGQVISAKIESDELAGINALQQRRSIARQSEQKALEE